MSKVLLSGNLEQKVNDTVNTALPIFEKIKVSINTIDGIAERTNVLSIYTAIEVVRMGSKGVGFRVISGNIKILTREVQNLTTLINSLMDVGQKNLNKEINFLKYAMESQKQIINRAMFK